MNTKTPTLLFGAKTNNYSSKNKKIPLFHFLNDTKYQKTTLSKLNLKNRVKIKFCKEICSKKIEKKLFFTKMRYTLQNKIINKIENIFQNHNISITSIYVANNKINTTKNQKNTQNFRIIMLTIILLCVLIYFLISEKTNALQLKADQQINSIKMTEKEIEKLQSKRLKNNQYFFQILKQSSEIPILVRLIEITKDNLVLRGIVNQKNIPSFISQIETLEKALQLKSVLSIDNVKNGYIFCNLQLQNES